ncbi:MAG: hypothetical protein PHF67_02340 [Candidatus Nanoarchaeia archaeon]|nr:hypothetical protein [Candidatus Nanoarchaeia archaeon]
MEIIENNQIRIAFSKVKQDMFALETEISKIKLDINEINNSINELRSYLSSFLNKNTSTDNPANQQINTTTDRYPTDNPTVPQEIKGLKNQILDLSTGNRGVPTDRQTNQQTVQQTQNTSLNVESELIKASEILNSLDHLKKEIRLKFKQLTAQEMLVFSTIYQLEEKDPQNTTYPQIASILGLSESSIRDYTQKIIKNGIPIKKQKINNKKILLSISFELKKIATLSTILQLREL